MKRHYAHYHTLYQFLYMIVQCSKLLYLFRYLFSYLFTYFISRIQIIASLISLSLSFSSSKAFSFKLLSPKWPSLKLPSTKLSLSIVERACSPYHKHSGFTFVEVLVSFFILTTGILGAALMQVTVQKSSFDVAQRTLATIYASSIIEQIRSNHHDVITLSYYQGDFGYQANLTQPTKQCHLSSSLCSAQERAVYDRYHWHQIFTGANVLLNKKNVGGLVNGKGCIDYSSNRLFVVISWKDKLANFQDTSVTELSVKSTNSQATPCLKNTSQHSRVVMNSFIY